MGQFSKKVRIFSLRQTTKVRSGLMQTSRFALSADLENSQEDTKMQYHTTRGTPMPKGFIPHCGAGVKTLEDTGYANLRVGAVV